MASDRQVAESWSKRTQSTTENVLGIKSRYEALSAALMPERRGRGSRSMPASRLPVRVDAINTIVEIQTTSRAWLRAMRLELGWSLQRGSTSSALWTVSIGLEPLAEKAHDGGGVAYYLLDTIGVQSRRMLFAAQVVLGQRERPLRPRDMPCPYCGGDLVVYLEAGLIECPNAACTDAEGESRLWPDYMWYQLGRMIDVGRAQDVGSSESAVEGDPQGAEAYGEWSA